MSDTLPIIASRSAYAAYQRCKRLRYLQYEAPNGTGTPGWERRKLALPLATGIHTHHGLELVLTGASPSAAAKAASDRYREDVSARGLAAETDTHMEDVVEEQAAHVEALVLGWSRVRLPRVLELYEVVEVEREDRTPLAEDVVLASRADAILRRRDDQRMFVLNFKTVGQADDRWLRQWEVDMQLMTELLAAERRYGVTFAGVMIEGLVKGQRVAVDEHLKEIRYDDPMRADKIHHYADRTRLLYGYKCDADPPLTPQQYAWEGTTKKGWYKFAAWRESFARPLSMSPLAYWIEWLPEEVVEGQFVVVPPIYRDNERVESCVTQMVTEERRVRADVLAVELGVSLDATFTQNTHSCVYPFRCSHYEACWERGTLDDMVGSGLYQARVDHHGLKGGE